MRFSALGDFGKITEGEKKETDINVLFGRFNICLHPEWWKMWLVTSSVGQKSALRFASAIDDFLVGTVQIATKKREERKETKRLCREIK